MPRTPDRFPGSREEDEFILEDRGPGGDNGGDPITEGALRRVTNTLRFFVNGVITQIARFKNTPSGFDGVEMSGITNGQGLSWNNTNKEFEPTTFAGGSDELAKVSANDTTAGYLNGKITAGTNVTLTEVNDGGDEDLQISSQDELTSVSANDTTPGYLNGKLVAGDGVALLEQNDGSNETLEVKATPSWRRHFLTMGG